jgi:hypothetical protein
MIEYNKKMGGRNMKKFSMFLLIISFFAISFSNVTDFVPNDSKATFYIKNLSNTYESLKTVPTVGSFLSDPINAEMYVSNFVESFLASMGIEPKDFFESLKTDMAIFIQEPEENTYIFGIIFGELKNPNKFYDSVSKIIEPLSESGISFNPIYKEISGKKYLIMVQDKSIYEDSKKGDIKFYEQYENGIYFNINSSDLKNTGFAYIKDNYLIGTSTGNLNEDSVNQKYLKDVSDYNFLGTAFLASGFLPKDINSIKEIISIVAEPSIVENILKSSNGFEVNSNIDINIEDNIKISNTSYVKIDTSTQLKNIEPIMKENKLKYNYLDENHMEFEIKIDENISNTEMKALKYNMWKKSDNIFISEDNEENLNKKLQNSIKLSENKTYEELSKKIGTANLVLAFVDFSKFFEKFGASENFGFLLNVNYLGNGAMKADFVLK